MTVLYTGEVIASVQTESSLEFSKWAVKINELKFSSQPEINLFEVYIYVNMQYFLETVNIHNLLRNITLIFSV